MWLINLILNIACLLLWLKWREKGRDAFMPGISLVTTLKKATPRYSPTLFLLTLLGLLTLRPILYWQLGAALNWTPKIPLGVISLPFRSDYFGRIFLFSFFSFGATLTVFYLTLILLSVMSSESANADPVRNFIRLQLGNLDLLPNVLKVILPGFLMLLLWCFLSKPLAALGSLPAPKSFLHIVEQGGVIAIGIYIFWKHVIVAVLLFYLLNSYIYFGNWAFLTFIDNTARGFLKLIAWVPLRLGRIDFAPVVGIGVVSLVAELVGRGLVWLYQRLPL